MTFIVLLECGHTFTVSGSYIWQNKVEKCSDCNKKVRVMGISNGGY